MKLYVTVKTNIWDAIIDYIEVKTPAQTITIDWDESMISRTDDGFTACYKGIYFDEEYANGRISELEEGFVSDIQIYTEQKPDNPEFQFLGALEFCDGDRGFLLSKCNSPNIVYEMP